MYNYDMTKGTMTLPCKRCGEFNTINTWYNLNGKNNKKQKKLLLNGELFKYKCKRCKNIILVSYGMMYHDVKNKVIVYLDPQLQYTEEIKHKIDLQRKELGSDYRFRIVNSVKKLQEKANIFEFGFDDRILELIKLEAVLYLKEKSPQLRVNTILFEYKHKKIIFNVFGFDLERDSEFSFPFTMTINEYNFNEKIIHNKIILKEALIVDSQWARQMIF